MSRLLQSQRLRVAGETCEGQELTALRTGTIPKLWEDVADGDDECVHFYFSLMSHMWNLKQSQPLNWNLPISS